MGNSKVPTEPPKPFAIRWYILRGVVGFSVPNVRGKPLGVNQIERSRWDLEAIHLHYKTSEGLSTRIGGSTGIIYRLSIVSAEGERDKKHVNLGKT